MVGSESRGAEYRQESLIATALLRQALFPLSAAQPSLHGRMHRTDILNLKTFFHENNVTASLYGLVSDSLIALMVSIWKN